MVNDQGKNSGRFPLTEIPRNSINSQSESHVITSYNISEIEGHVSIDQENSQNESGHVTIDEEKPGHVSTSEECHVSSAPTTTGYVTTMSLSLQSNTCNKCNYIVAK
jgi:hypothetical protein